MLNRVFFEGKMRAPFGMVFGAGVFLFVASKERSGRPARGLFYRRMGWLVLFGVVHAWLLLWSGDILYLYGIAGMVVYLLRSVPPRYLMLGVPLVALLDFGAATLFYRDIREKRIAYVEAQRSQAEHGTTTDAEARAIAAWRAIEKTLIPNRADVAENTRKMRGGYAEVASVVRPLAREFETTLALVSLPDSLVDLPAPREPVVALPVPVRAARVALAHAHVPPRAAHASARARAAGGPGVSCDLVANRRCE